MCIAEIGSVFTVMKKNVTKSANNQAMDALLKRQMEDRAFNKMMFWLIGALVVEVFMLFINRFYVHVRVDEINFYVALHHVLGVLPVVGVLLFVALLLWGLKLRKQEQAKSGTWQIITASAALTIGIGAFLIRTFGGSAAPMVLAAVPGLALLALVFYLYPKEFFVCGIAGGLAILGLWTFRVVGMSPLFYAYLAVVLVLAASAALFLVMLQKKDGALEKGEKKWVLFQPDAAYLAYYLTAALAAVLLLAPLLLGAAVAYYGIWIMAAWLFILAVYFTSKLI